MKKTLMICGLAVAAIATLAGCCNKPCCAPQKAMCCAKHHRHKCPAQQQQPAVCEVDCVTIEAIPVQNAAPANAPQAAPAQPASQTPAAPATGNN